MITKDYSGSRAYSQSKLSQIMFTIDLANELTGSGVTVNSLHPATYMNTTMVREGGITPILDGGAGRRSDPASRRRRRRGRQTGLFFNGMQPRCRPLQAYDAKPRETAAALQASS